VDESGNKKLHSRYLDKINVFVLLGPERKKLVLRLCYRLNMSVQVCAYLHSNEVSG